MNESHDLSDAPSRLPAEMQAWFEALPDAEQDELERVWHVAAWAQDDAPAAEVVAAAWAQVSPILAARPPTPVPSPRADRGARPRPPGRGLRLALPLLVVLLVGGGLAFWLRPVTLTTRAGATVSALLPDGSRVVLNGSSSLVYRRGLRGPERVVHLEGEAFFEVVEADKAFVVRTFNAEVRVLGTRFDVRARPASAKPETAVVLEAGTVALVSLADEAARVVLVPEQTSRLAGGDLQPSMPTPANLDAALAWRTGGFAALNAPLHTVLEELVYRFGVEIHTPETIRTDTLSVLLPQAMSAEAVLADVCRYLGYRYRPAPGGFEILVNGE